MNKSIRKRGRNAEIELLRFIFATFIVLRHSGSIWDYNEALYPFFIKGAFAVDFFFLLSGYLLMATVEKTRKKSIDAYAPATDTIIFLKRKISGFYPELIVANIIGLVILIFTTTKPLSEFVESWILSFPSDYLLLHMWIFTPSYNGPIWYLSTMLLFMAILYPLLRKWPEFMSAIICPVISILLIGYLWYTYHSLLGPEVWIGFTYKGNMRGLIELCAGVFMFRVVNVLKNKDLTYLGMLLVTYVKWGCYIYSFYWLTYASDSTLQLFILSLYILGLIFTFSEKCLDYDIYQNIKVFLYLGRLSTSLYLSHYYALYFFKYLVREQFVLVRGMECREMVVSYYLLSLIVAIIVSSMTYAIKYSGLYRAFTKCIIRE